MNIESLRDRLLDLQEASETIVATAAAEKRDYTDDERQQIDACLVEQATVEKDITRITSIESNAAKLQKGDGRKSASNPIEKIEARGERHTDVRVIERPGERGKSGFRNFGEFAMAVKSASHRGASVDPRIARIMNADPGSTYGSEGVGSDGGIAVPPDFRQEIMTKVFAEEALVGRTDGLESSSNSITLPLDETTPWQSTGGIQAYWTGEKGQLTASKPALEPHTTHLHKLTVLVPVTDELMEDAAGMDSWLRRKAPEKMDWKLTDAIVNGSGAGQPLGILNAAALVSVAKEGSQPADTILAENIFNMHARMYAPCRRSAVWLINQDIEPQLHAMTIAVKNVAGSENVGGAPVYMPAGGLSGSAFASMYGRPVVPTEACPTLGDKGDIIFADLSQYMSVTKAGAGGLRTDVSMHLYFDYDALAYRFILRFGGAPWWNSSIARKSGSNNLSCFVTLDERA